jgi:ATP-dependent DNA ligase
LAPLRSHALAPTAIDALPPDQAASFYIDGDGAMIFQHVCQLGLEGVVSKRRDLPTDRCGNQDVSMKRT